MDRNIVGPRLTCRRIKYRHIAPADAEPLAGQTSAVRIRQPAAIAKSANRRYPILISGTAWLVRPGINGQFAELMLLGNPNNDLTSVLAQFVGY